ncbi:hypothetical protein QTI66_04420 [Variovorax sp. J22R133]|uniref:hypothetical protein n=1 Tax=Variovorax brevis TaxID=3053503 RepID=UPI0025752778|nr:hypothetical protein [Variovorax sp. J22R133]MDM0111380.1 hypothetical protein [Variovorax sp. J22R133]
MDRPFDYRNFHFLLRVEPRDANLFMPGVRCESGPPGTQPVALPPDADPYASEAEAWRHAEQQAMRWVHDRTGDSQGQF